jgi:EF-P beta-lysylation protein EpmB
MASLQLIPSTSSWRTVLRSNFTHWMKLADFLEWDEAQRCQILQKPRFPLNLPMRLAQKIEKGTWEDPVLKQFLPTFEEAQEREGFVLDPVGDTGCRKSPKLLQKYQGRVLLVCTSACAMHCRYCFRQNFDYETEDKTFVEEIELIRQDQTIHEVILSGGDPLMIREETLEFLLRTLSQMPHLTRFRFHTRVPIGIPERIDPPFLKLLGSLPQQIWFVIHCNHPRELDPEIIYRIKQLQRLGINVLSQAVLLKGVNDDVETLKSLCETLVNLGIFPYYLHQLDRVRGASRFEVPEEKGKWLIQEISKQLPGYAVPKYVREIAGEPSKTTLSQGWNG